jgi:uncharacterized membrane protein
VVAVNRRVGPKRRALIGAAAAAVTLVIAVLAGATWTIALLAAWLAAAIAYLALVWPVLFTLDAAATARLARAEEGSRRISEAVLLGAGTASLIAVGFTLAQAGRTHHWHRAALTALALTSVASAWACVHTVYTIRYARLYFTEPAGGLGFEGADPPNYRDFAYVAFTIGMTYQVSDTSISKRPLRRAAIHHALLSYLFGAVILAIVVSTVASILGS